MLFIYIQQLREHMVSLRAPICIVTVMLFFSLNGTLSLWRAESLTQVDHRLQVDVDRRYDQVESVNQAVGQIFRLVNRATGTEFITEGGFDWYYNSFWFSPSSGDYPFWYMGRDVNVWMTRFQNLDWTLIVNLVISFLCIVLAYDGISGELELGTLRLILTNPLSRAKVLMGKYLAHASVLTAAVLMGSLLSLAIVSLGGNVELNDQLLRSYAIFIAATLIYMSIFLFVALGVSALMASSVTALIVLTFTWAVVVVIVPQASYVVAKQAVEVPAASWENMSRMMAGLKESLTDEGITVRPMAVAAQDDFATERNYIQRIKDGEKEQQSLGRHMENLALQRHDVARAINMISPGYAFTYSVESAFGTGVVKRQSFRDQAWAYRSSLRDFLKQQDDDDPASPHVSFLPGFMSDRELEGRDIPRFKERQVSIGESMEKGVVPFTLLALEALAMFAFALWATNRLQLSTQAGAD